MIGLPRSELVSMSMEAQIQLNGLEDQTYLNSFQVSTGDEQQSLLITHSSILPYSLGGIAANPLLSSTRYQWHELYVAWKLVTHSQNLRTTLVYRPKAKLYTQLMEFTSYTPRSKESSLSTANMMCFCARKFSAGWLYPIHLRNLGSST